MVCNWDEMIWERCNYFARLIRSDPGVGQMKQMKQDLGIFS